MASSEEIIQVLGTLQVAFPAYKPANAAAMVDLYTRKLSRFPSNVLNAAADRLIDVNKFFPSIAELGGTAKEIWEQESLSNRPYRARQALEDKFYAEGILDEGEWVRLSKEFLAAGWEYGAAAIMEKFRRLAEGEKEPAA